MTATFEMIEKENISGLKFPSDDVLKDKGNIAEMETELNTVL